MNSECSDIFAQLESWYDRDTGQYLLRSLRDALAERLDTTFGYHILQLGVTRGHPLYQGSPINHRIYAAERPGDSIGLVCDAQELPLDSDSVDAVIAHHSLEFAINPHQVLREIQRVLTPQGQLLLIGFNPYSLMGLNAMIRGRSAQSFWHHCTPVSENRLTDWLHLLGCEVQDCDRLCAIPPFGSERVQRLLMRWDGWTNRQNLHGGGVYVLHAIKQVSALHKPRQSLRLRGERLIGLAVPQPRPVPSPTPATPIQRRDNGARNGNGDVAA
tara:strand:+ start:73083 stop:73898 length:816 start_codon:yes stop_codon:yes gene_type:complete